MWMALAGVALAADAGQEVSDARALAEYEAKSVYVVPVAEGYQLRDGRNRRLDPGRFAMRTDDWLTWHRYDYEMRVLRTVAVSFYITGGASALIGANVFPQLAQGYEDESLQTLAEWSGRGLVVAGFGMIGSGYVLLRVGKDRLNDPTRYWTEDQALALAAAHNEELRVRLGLDEEDVLPVGPPQARLSLAVMPNGLALAAVW